MNSSTQVSIESRMNLIISATNKIPKTMLFKIGTDIDKIKEYLSYVYSENQELNLIDEDLVIRMVIAKHLRTINMKLTNVSVLLIVALEDISRNDLNISENILVAKLVNQNREKFDLDTISKITAQIRTKLPKDLSSRLTHEHLINVKNVIVSNLETIDNLTEHYQDIKDLDLSKIDTPQELSMFHMELSKHRGDTSYESQESRHKKLKELKEKEQELIRAKDLEHINRADEEKINAHYIEREPVLMIDPDTKKMYHHDEYSASLQRLPNEDELQNVSPEQIEQILREYDISSEELQETLDYLKNNKILDMEAAKYIFKENKDYTDRIVDEEITGNIPSDKSLMMRLLIGLSIILLVIVTVSFIFLRHRNMKIKNLSSIKNRV
jgi:hypothetical protein